VTRDAPDARDASPDEPSGEERGLLLRAARAAIEAHLRGIDFQAPGGAVARGALALKRGAFVTLKRRADGELRGCVGLMGAERPLVETVVAMAVAAATEDGRFEPVTLEQLPGLAIEISALGPMRPIRPEDVEVGRHGLLISLGRRRGVLLPQVPLEQGWDRETFLAHTCWKAGLPEDAWRDPSAELLGFTATVFGEGEG
jgi:AmmeMemoRadiSam system protein A